VLAFGDVAEEDADLAIVDLAEAAAPWPLDADGRLPFRGESRGIEDEHRVGAAQRRGDLAVQFVHRRHVVPRGGAEEVLQGLAVEVKALGDGLGILVLEAGEVGAGMRLTLRAGERGDEGMREALEAVDDATERGGWDLRVSEQLVLALLEPGLHLSLLPSGYDFFWKVLEQNCLRSVK
jgi:hypothetical protein